MKDEDFTEATIRSPLLSSIIADFDEHLTARERSKRTHGAYAFILRELDAYGLSRLGRPLRLSDLTLPLLEGFIAHRELGSATKAHRVYCLRTLFNFLVTRKLVADNVAKLMQAPKVDIPPPDHLKQSEIVKMLAAPGAPHPAYDYHRWQISKALLARDMALLELLYSAAVRNEESHTLRLDQVKLGAREVVLTVKGKGNKTGEMLITGPLADKLRAYLKVRGELVREHSPPLLLLSKNGRALTNAAVSGIVRRWCAAAKIDRKTWPHLLRHSRATHLLRSGASPAAVQDLLRHSSERTTRRYAHGGLLFQKEQNTHHPSLKLIHRVRNRALDLVDRLLGRKGLAED